MAKFAPNLKNKRTYAIKLVEKFLDGTLAPHFYLFERFFTKTLGVIITLHIMFKAIGFVIALFAMAHFFGNAISALDSALVQSFNTLETAASLAQDNLLNK